MRLTHGYCLQQAAWWQRQAAIEHESLQYWQKWWCKKWSWASDSKKNWDTAVEGVNKAMRRHRIAHQTARDYLDVAEYLLRLETVARSVVT